MLCEQQQEYVREKRERPRAEDACLILQMRWRIEQKTTEETVVL